MPPILALSLLAVLQTTGAAAPSAKPPWTVLPDWLVKPSSRDIEAYYPREAMKARLPGEAQLRCLVAADTTLRDCVAVSENPEGYGFGQAALKLTSRMRMKPARVNGVAVDDAPVTIPIRFSLPPVPSDDPMHPLLARPGFSDAPSQAQVRAAYPAAALRARQAGVGSVRCTVQSLRLVDCRRKVGADPYGFNEAARSLAPAFQVWDREGRLTVEGSSVDIEVLFAPDDLLTAGNEGNPVWLKAPNLDDVLATFPADAKAKGLKKVSVLMTCKIGVDGYMSECQTLGVAPSAFEVKDSGLRLATRFRASVWSDRGRPSAGATIRMPLTWDLDALTAAKARLSAGPPPP